MENQKKKQPTTLNEITLYKETENKLTKIINQKDDLQIISVTGPYGSGKTKFIRDLVINRKTSLKNKRKPFLKRTIYINEYPFFNQTKGLKNVLSFFNPFNKFQSGYKNQYEKRNIELNGIYATTTKVYNVVRDRVLTVLLYSSVSIVISALIASLVSTTNSGEAFGVSTNVWIIIVCLIVGLPILLSITIWLLRYTKMRNTNLVIFDNLTHLDFQNFQEILEIARKIQKLGNKKILVVFNKEEMRLKYINQNGSDADFSLFLKYYFDYNISLNPLSIDETIKKQLVKSEIDFLRKNSSYDEPFLGNVENVILENNYFFKNLKALRETIESLRKYNISGSMKQVRKFLAEKKWLKKVLPTLITIIYLKKADPNFISKLESILFSSQFKRIIGKKDFSSSDLDNKDSIEILIDYIWDQVPHTKRESTVLDLKKIANFFERNENYFGNYFANLKINIFEFGEGTEMNSGRETELSILITFLKYDDDEIDEIFEMKNS